MTLLPKIEHNLIYHRTLLGVLGQVIDDHTGFVEPVRVVEESLGTQWELNGCKHCNNIVTVISRKIKSILHHCNCANFYLTQIQSLSCLVSQKN